MAYKKGRKAIPADEKKELLSRITTLKLEGYSTSAVAEKCGLNWHTVDKWYTEILAATVLPDPAELIRERSLITEQAFRKVLRGFHDGVNNIKDLETSLNLADKYNGVSRYLDSASIVALPPLLELKIISVDLDDEPS